MSRPLQHYFTPILSAFILVVLLPLVVCSIVAAADCHISAEWSKQIEGNTRVEARAILPSPHCLLLSERSLNGSNYHYALNVRDGSVAWQWPTAPLGPHKDEEALHLQPSAASPDRVYAMVVFMQDATNSIVCAVLAALHSANGTVIWSHELCSASQLGNNPTFVVLQAATATASERIALAFSNINVDTGDGNATLHIVDGSMGSLLLATNQAGLLDFTLTAIGNGREGYFSLVLYHGLYSQSVQLYQLTAKNELKQVAAKPDEFYDALLLSQPTLHYDNDDKPTQLVAHDVASDKQVWTNQDSFLLREWGQNDTYQHLSTVYDLVARHNDLFLVINSADDRNATVITQAALYQLSTGKEAARSEQLTFEQLHYIQFVPQTWQFDDVLLLRFDTVWYTLRLPTLKLVKHGHYASSDESNQQRGWQVDVDGSYVSLSNQADSILAHGYPPYSTSSAAVQPLDKPLNDRVKLRRHGRPSS